MIRTVDPPCYLKNQSPVQGEHQSEDVSPPTDPAANEQISSDSSEQAIPTEEPVTVTTPDLNQSNLESELNDEVVAQSRIISYHPVDNIIGDVSHGVQTQSQTGLINICRFFCFLS